MAAQEEFFAGIPKIPYRPDAGAGDVLSFKYYNAEEVLMGRKMEDWLRFSVCYWHSFCGTGADPFGFPTLLRPWNEGTPLESAKKRLRAAFEFFTKLGVKYYTFHDRDMAPEGSTLEDSNRNLDEITDLALQLQSQTGVKVLWVTCNLFAHQRYMNGAATNPDCHVVAFAGAQVKKGLDIAKKLGAENFVFWGGREGFLSIHNTDVAAELKHMANFFKMAVKYKEKIGLKCQFLIEPKPKEPCKHQYDYDAMSVIGFLKHYGLESHFKLNIEPNHTTLAGHSYEHDIVMASAFGMLGSVDSNTGSPDLGWDTDQFPMDIRNTTLVMKTVIEQGGLQPGGLNFDAKVRRESTDLEDLFIAHIGAMDAFARGLRNAVRVIEDGLIAGMLKERYSSFSHGIGQKVEDGSATFEEMEAFIKHNDAMSVIGFLKHYGLESHFKLNIEPNHTTLAGHSYEHDIVMASAFGMLGSVDSNTGSPDLGWDTDQFPMDIRNTTLVMKTVIEQGGLQPGGLNFDAKVRRESTDLEDLFIAHIGAMDAFARGLRNAVRVIEDGLIAGMVKERYSSFSHGIGQKVEDGSATFEEMEVFIKHNGEPKVTSGKQEKADET